MPAKRTRRFLIEIKDAEGTSYFRSVAYWDDKDSRTAITQIRRLAGLPDADHPLPDDKLAPKRATD